MVTIMITITIRAKIIKTQTKNK